MVTMLAVVQGLGLGQKQQERDDQELVQEQGQDNSIRTVGRKPTNNLTGPITADLTGPVNSDLTGSALAHWCGYRLWLLAATAGETGR